MSAVITDSNVSNAADTVEEEVNLLQVAKRFCVGALLHNIIVDR